MTQETTFPVFDIGPFVFGAHGDMHRYEKYMPNGLPSAVELHRGKVEAALKEIEGKEVFHSGTDASWEEKNLDEYARFFLHLRNFFQNIAGFRIWAMQALDTVAADESAHHQRILQELQKAFAMQQHPLSSDEGCAFQEHFKALEWQAHSAIHDLCNVCPDIFPTEKSRIVTISRPTFSRAIDELFRRVHIATEGDIDHFSYKPHIVIANFLDNARTIFFHAAQLRSMAVDLIDATDAADLFGSQMLKSSFAFADDNHHQHYSPEVRVGS